MSDATSLDEFLLRSEDGRFCVFEASKVHMNYGRKGFYMIAAVSGHVEFSYGDKVIATAQDSLLFTDPRTPFKMAISEGRVYGCLFTDAFLEQFQFIRSYPLYKTEEIPLFPISAETRLDVCRIFDAMACDMSMKFAYKRDSVRNNLFQLICIGLKCIGNKEPTHGSSNSALRLFSLFDDLLVNQFQAQDVMKLRHPGDFASALLIHVNHLNRALKSVTGKTTSMLIAEKIIAESRMRLRHTNYTCSEIAWSLGFEQLPHFINFFKRNVGATPNSYRKNVKGPERQSSYGTFRCFSE